MNRKNSVGPTDLAGRTLCWTLNGGEQVPLQVGDEVRIGETGIPGVPFHMGIIYDLGDVTRDGVKVIDCNKGVGVGVQSWEEFLGERIIGLTRRPNSPQHAADIWKRGHDLIGKVYYHAVFANCEQFTDYCYTGKAGKSPTLGNFLAVAGSIAAIVVMGQFSSGDE